MRAMTQADIVCDKARILSKSAELAAKQKCEATIKDLALRLAQSKILELEDKLAKMSKLAHEDPLTGIFNRRGCQAALARELSHCRRHNIALSLALIDIDDFKRINDTYGHATGDAALVQFAKRINASLRAADIFARVGGEEFLLILSGTDIRQAECTMERLQQTLSSAVLRVGAEDLSLTFSVGVAQLKPGDTAEALTDRADSAARAAKKRGKNCVVCS